MTGFDGIRRLDAEIAAEQEQDRRFSADAGIQAMLDRLSARERERAAAHVDLDHDAALTHYRGLQGRLEDEEAEAEAGGLDAKLERMRESDGIARRLRSLRYRATRSTPAESRSLYEEIERLEARRDAVDVDGALAEGGR